MTELLLFQKFILEFNKSIKSKKGYTFLTQQKYTTFSGRIFYADAVVIKNNQLLAVFDFKPNINSPISSSIDFTKSFDSSFKFYIISDGRNHKIFNLYSNTIQNTSTTRDLLDLITKIPSEKDINSLNVKITSIIEDKINEFIDSFENRKHKIIKKKQEIISHFSIDNIRRNLIYDEDGQFFHLSKDIRDMDNFENTFFKIITEEVKENENIYRYTTLETVFATIDNQNLRLNGIVGMNDISEVGYVETYLDKNFIPFESENDIEELNNRFIMCSSVLSDDLMQWRLYGDDCKGGCLVFNVKKDSNIPGLQLRKINYGIIKNKENFHPELELIKTIINSVKDELKESLRFRTLAIWKHIFKSYEYSPEKEVRLLMILNKNNYIKGEKYQNSQNHTINKKWTLTTSHKIANPYVNVALPDDINLPIKLKKIVLGTKCPESITNKKQFKQLLKDRGLNDIDIELSEIKNYR